MLTGAGGTAVPALIEMLKSNGYRVIAADMDCKATSLYLADKGFVIPPGNSEDFLPTVQRICKKEGVQAIIPLVDEELVKCHELDDVEVILPNKQFVALCLDKWELMQQLSRLGIPAPETRLPDGSGGMTFPIIAKPRTGRGSRNVAAINSENELGKYLASHRDVILQEYIGGMEYTVSVLVWRDGIVQAVVPKEIICKKGVTRIAVTRRNEDIDLICREVQNKLHANGPFNVQLRLDDEGKPRIFEINPRFSTSITLTMEAGVNELLILLRQALTGQKPRELEWREGVVLLRQTRDMFIDENNYNLRRGRIEVQL